MQFYSPAMSMFNQYGIQFTNTLSHPVKVKIYKMKQRKFKSYV